MADYKESYSTAANNYINNIIPNSEIDQERYNRSKKQEKLYNEEWSKEKVNINQIIEQFSTKKTDKINGYKVYYDGDRYQVRADMVAGYLRIYDKKLKSFVKLDGTVGDNTNTHFKIKKRDEM